MNRNRAIAALLAAQLLVVLLLSQTWYTISMAPNGTQVALGDFSGSDANPSALATAIFALLAILVAAFTRATARMVSLIFTVVANSALALFVTDALLQQRITALDGALDRLTGIAQSHGIKDLSIETAWLAYAWLGAVALSIILGIGSLLWQRKWLTEPKPPVVQRQSKAKQTKVSTLDLWDDQRK